MKKLVLVFTALLILTFTVGAQSTIIDSPEEGSSFEKQVEDVVIVWFSNSGEGTSTLESSKITLEDDQGTTFDDQITNRNEELPEDDEALYEYDLSWSDVDNLDPGSVQLTIEDEWEETTSSSEIEIIFTEIEVESNIQDPQQDQDHDTSDNLNVEWDVSNEGQEPVELDLSQISIIDEDGIEISEELGSISISEGDKITRSEEFTSSQLEDLSDGQEWSIEVEDFYGERSSTDNIQIFAEEDFADEELEQGEFNIEIDEPSSSVKPFEEDINAEWISDHTYNSDQLLIESELRIEDPIGRPIEKSVSQDETLSEGEELVSETTFEQTEWAEDFDEGTWEIIVTDSWEEGTVEESLSFEMEKDDGDDSDEDELSASASVDATDVEVIEELEFDGSDSTGDIESYEWDFEDGNTDTGESVSHSFDEAGIYDVELEVADDTGIDTDTLTVSVDPMDSDELNAVIQADSTSVEPGEDLEFDGSSSTGDIDEYNWDFDDGNSDSGETVTRSFEDTGTYTVELEVENGETDTDTLDIDVEESEDDEGGEDTETTDEDTGDGSDDGERGDPQADDEDTGDETGEETDEETETEGDDGECPGGFVYDEDNDVCIESDEESDGSVGALDSVTSPEVAGIPVWLVTVLAAFAGLQAYWW